MKKQILTIVATLLLIFPLAACQATPEMAVVASKSGQDLEDTIRKNEEAANENEAESESALSVPKGQTYTEEFTSMDGSVSYTIELDIPEAETRLPALQVTPHTITSEEAEAVARVLFGDAEFYEVTDQSSKQELEESILLLKQIIEAPETVDVPFDRNRTEYYQQLLESLYEQYEIAPEIVERKFCDWVFHPPSYYGNTAEEDDGHVYIKATTSVDGMPYIYSVCNYDGADYQVHRISASLDNSLLGVNEMYSDQEPTDEDVQAAVKEAEDLLEKMEPQIGEWVIDSHDITVLSDLNAENPGYLYLIEITASPVYNGVAATRHVGGVSLRSNDLYSSNYDYEDITIRFSCGRMVWFYYRGPLQIVDVLSDDVELLSFDDAMRVFKTQMKLNDAEYYFGASDVRVYVDQIALGLTRTRIQNNQTDYYLVPSFTFSGITCIYDNDGKLVELYDIKGETKEPEQEELLTINAVDGTVINTELGY